MDIKEGEDLLHGRGPAEERKRLIHSPVKSWALGWAPKEGVAGDTGRDDTIRHCVLPYGTGLSTIKERSIPGSEMGCQLHGRIVVVWCSRTAGLTMVGQGQCQY